MQAIHELVLFSNIVNNVKLPALRKRLIYECYIVVLFLDFLVDFNYIIVDRIYGCHK